MEKLLHERLREKANSDCGTTCTVNSMFADCDKYEHCADCTSTCLNRIADEIERYYIPRLRDNKGIPFVEGETVWSTDSETEYSAEVLSVFPNGIQVRWEDGFVDWRDGIELQHERPQPKVLDADGVEIKVGDTVYGVTSGETYEVTLLDKDDCGHACLRNDYGQHWHGCEGITHKEPDSLEKLRDDMVRYHSDFDAWGEMLDRLSALIERGA